MRRISSRQNPLVARFRALARARGSDGTILLDGEHLVEEALDAGVDLETVAFAERIVDSRAEGLVSRVERAGAEAVSVPEHVLSAMSPARQPSGIVAIARHQPAAIDALLGHGVRGGHGEQGHGTHGIHGSHPLLLVLDGVQDPGNVGAIISAADGCGATGVIATDGTADPFGWKALRGAMGSTFRLPIGGETVRSGVGGTTARMPA